MNYEHPTSYPHVFYIHNIQHRDGNRRKSQWTITELEERSCFEHGALFVYVYGVCESHTCWGLHFLDNSPAYLGHSADELQERRLLLVAKFVDGNGNNHWHGYPADHVKNNQDIPPSAVRNIWLNSGQLTLAKIRKITRGQICNL